MGVADKTLGSILIVASFVIFVYYTAWVFLLPFAEENNPLYKFFLPQEYAILIPAILLVLAIFIVCAFIGLVLYKEANKKKVK